MGATYKELFKLFDLIQSGDVRLVDQFVTSNTVNINEILPCKGIGVLHLAVGIEPLEKSKECTELLLKHGADPNLMNDDGITPLHIAAIWGRVANLKLLIGCGGDPYRRDLDGLSAFDYAAREEQWEVYDYLHNVEDQTDDSTGSPCAYSLDLERILVTTDQVVASYEPVPEDKTWTATCRKSDMVRDWCEKTSLVVNKLYPTILTDTFTIDNENSWQSTKLTTKHYDLTSDNTTIQSNDTLNTYRTCLEKSPIEISGIKPLEMTSDETKSSDQPRNKQRLSMYENFSLPGSPNSIIHRNYNTKTSLKKDKKDAICETHITFDDSSVMTSDGTERSVDLDKAIAVIQNKRNEWLSRSSSDGQKEDCNANNTRRSSASSGVSSNYSGGSIVLANVEEEYKYEDKQEDVVLIEKRLRISSVVLPVDDSADASPDQTILSVASSLPPCMEYDVESLRRELQRLGFNPGPIQDSNKTLYLKKLNTLKKNNVVEASSLPPCMEYDVESLRRELQRFGFDPGPIQDSNKTFYVNKLNTLKKNTIVEATTTQKSQGKTYSIELEKSLRSDDWMRNLTIYIDLENKAREDFLNPNKKWREGTAKTSFTYLLLDPRITSNLPAKASVQNQHESWKTFVSSIFYVGKGKRSRPYSHLYQALTLWKRNFTTSKDKKVQHILDIWSDKVGVVCLHIFQNVIPAEAYTYEAAMIDVLGVQNLKNLKCGNYYGVVSSWPLKERRMLGQYLLYKAMLIFLSEGERQLRPDDID